MEEKDRKPKVIALYLPQYHPTTDNDRWWGKGFTEWTNVGKARPLFRGHYQPKVPADLGYYDLRVPETREEQARLAREAGISGFCYYHYWFGNGKEELSLPFDEVLKTGKPDFPFCLCWANESWHAKFWNKDGSAKKKLLLEQTYPGKEDHIAHFLRLLPAFRDRRYITIEGKPLFMVYQPLQLPDAEEFIRLWDSLARENGLPGMHIIATTQEDRVIGEIMEKGYRAVNFVPMWTWPRKRSVASRLLRAVKCRLLHMTMIDDYRDAIKYFYGDEIADERIIPAIIPNWDHTPRSGRGGTVLLNATPANFRKHVHDVFSKIRGKDNNLVFLKSWNEWGEGNYMEPDLRFGHGYLDALRAEMDNYDKDDEA